MFLLSVQHTFLKTLNLMLIYNLRLQFFTHDFSLTETASASISSPHHCTLKNFSFIYTSTISYCVIITLPMQGINNIHNNGIAFSTTSSTYSKSMSASSPKSWHKKKSPASLELQGSLPHSQETINGCYPRPVEFSLHNQTLPYAIIFWCSATNMLQTYLIFPMHDISHTLSSQPTDNAQAVQIFMLPFCSVCTTYCYFLSVTCKWLEC